MAEYREDDDYLLDGDDDDDDYEMTRRRPGAEDLDLVDIIGEDEEADKQMKILDQDLVDLASKSIDMDEGSDPEDANQEVNKKNETEKIDKLLETPPGLNLFPVDLSSNQNGFKHFNLGKITILSKTLSLEKDFAYGRRGKLKGHGYSDELIDEILSDKLTFIRHLMPEAQSVLLCDKADFKSIMDFLFYSITVCTERTLSELLIKSFFDLCKNYSFSWRLDLKHIMTVLDNYGINPNIVQEGRCNDVLEEYRIACGKGKFRIKLQTFYQDLKRKQVEFTPVPGDKFTFCLYNFILFVSEISVGTPSRLDFRTKNDWSDLCVLIFIFSLLGTEQRFVTNYRVFESISNMFLYHFDSIPAKYWYCGSDRESLTEKKRHKFTSLNFPKFLALMIHEFYPGERGSDVMCWKPETMGRLEQKTELQQRLKDLHQMEHGLNIIHKLEMLPASYRGNQVKRFLAFLYMSTCLDCAIPQRVVFPSIVDVADSSLLSSTYLRILMHKNYSRFSEILVIVKLCDMIVGNDLITDFSKDKVPSIIKVRKDLLEKLTKKLPSTSSAHKSGNITILFQLRNHLQIVMQRWNFGCESS